MNPVGKALWFIESHFAQEITLEDIAKSGGVSRYHMSQVFGIATGLSVMRYVRGRRLTEAARCLASGAPDILAIALEAGYGSPETFTRPFCSSVGVPTLMIPAPSDLGNIKPIEPTNMEENLTPKTSQPR